MYKVAAIDTTNGNHTACDEAVLCERHDNAANRAKLERGLYHRPTEPVIWERVDDNEACQCLLC
jgi:hypothetical protein